MAAASPCSTAGSVRFRISFPIFSLGIEPRRWKSICPILSLDQGAQFAGGGDKRLLKRNFSPALPALWRSEYASSLGYLASRVLARDAPSDIFTKRVY